MATRSSCSRRAPPPRGPPAWRPARACLSVQALGFCSGGSGLCGVWRWRDGGVSFLSSCAAGRRCLPSLVVLHGTAIAATRGGSQQAHGSASWSASSRLLRAAELPPDAQPACGRPPAPQRPLFARRKAGAPRPGRARLAPRATGARLPSNTLPYLTPRALRAQLPSDTTGINSSHVIHKLSFGSSEFPGQVNPLDGARARARHRARL